MVSEHTESQTMENQNSASNSALNESSDSLVLHKPEFNPHFSTSDPRELQFLEPINHDGP